MSSSKLSCLFCKESFEDKEQLQIHFRKHGDPKFNQNVKNNKNGSGTESQPSTEKSTEEAEVVGCDVCSDVFPTISKAITHKHKVHPDHDAKYFCPWCGKLFTMKHLYNKHIESSHSSSEESKGPGFHCDYCDVNFFAATAMIYHNKFFHRQDTELAAIGYSKKLKHFDEEALPIYYCPFCGEEYFNKVNLHKHMGDDHIEEDQSPDDVLRCPLCEAIFYHLDAYELHLTFHSSEDLYNEENDIVQNITEFSLEAVPPLMEKVENESQEDEPDVSSMGIETFLQQAMNESNDNEHSNREGLPHKKKKHKKHKKSKKATITLDEFLSMNTDVFGEGLDVQVQGIVEVPSQVVAKQLRKPLILKSRPIGMQPKEIEKLRKQGITIKKKPVNINPQKMQVSKVNSDTINRNLKLPHTISAPKPTPIDTSDVINKLLSQGNSQIKIVKKSSQNNSNRESKAGKDPPDPTESSGENNEITKMECHDQETEDICKTAESNDSMNEFNLTETDRTKAIPLKWKDDPPFENDSLEDNLRQKNNINIDMTTNSNTAMDVLKSISQHITVKQVLNSKSNPRDGITSKDSATGLSPESIEKGTDRNHKVIESQTSDTESLNALKHLSNLTVKSMNQTKHHTSGNSRGMNKNSDVDLTIAKENTDDKLTVDKEETFSPISKSLEVLKNITKHITVKAPGKLPELTKNSDDSMDTENDDEDNSSGAISKIQANNIPTSIRPQNMPELKSLDVLKNLSKHITVKTQNTLSPIIGRSDEKTNSDNEDERHCELDDDENKTIGNENLISTNTSELHNNAKINSINALKSIGKYITVKTPKNSPIITDTDDIGSENEGRRREIDLENNDSAEFATTIRNPRNSVNSKPSLKPQFNSIDALKNISKHITVKAPIQASQVMENLAENSIRGDVDNSKDSSFAIREKHDVQVLGNVQNEQKQGTKSIDALRNISKFVTVKSLNKSSNGNFVNDHDDEHNSELDILLQDKQNAKTPNKLPIAPKPNSNFKSPDIIKQLPNITAKPCNVTQNHKQQVTSSRQSVHCVKSNFHESSQNVQKCVKTEQKCEAIETFSIDDSEDEEMNLSTNEKESKPVVEYAETKYKNALNIMKKLNSNITIKSSKQNLQEMNTLSHLGNISDDNSKAHSDNYDDVRSPEPVNQKTTMLQDTYKHLGKNVSIKSTSSPKASPKSRNSNQRIPKESVVSSSLSGNSKCSPKHDQQKNIALSNTLQNISKHISVKSTKTANNLKSEELYETGQDDSDSDTNLNVKITEIENDCSSDEEAISILKNKLNDTASNIIVEHPSENNSDNEDFDVSNVEDQITPTFIKKQMPEPCADNKLVKYNNQNTSFKSLQDLNFDEEDEDCTAGSSKLANTRKEMVSRHTKFQTNDVANSRTNQKVATSSQVNTVNKEVTVQTFKTQTVIEEITTTVTKTIRTVNQAMNQETRATSQNLSMPQMRHKIQGITPSQMNNIRGVPLRQPRPTIGMKVRNPARPSSIPVGSSNQMVAMRPIIARLQNPRMPVPKKCSNVPGNVPKVGSKPITVAQNAMAPPTKRPQESMGHFSCFKKPKESLIPVPDIPTTISDYQSNSSPVQFKSSAQMSKSNFASTSKVVKVNSVVTSSQMRSQTSSSTEHLSKLSSMSGLKVVKTSQKQSSQVEERSEVSAPKRNALEAIERLQRQGLLIKKPRVEDQLPDDRSGDDEYDDET